MHNSDAASATSSVLTPVAAPEGEVSPARLVLTRLITPPEGLAAPVRTLAGLLATLPATEPTDPASDNSSVLTPAAAPVEETAPARYAIYRGLLTTESLSEPELLAVVSDTVYLDLGAAGDTARNYFYQVRTVDIDGQPLSPSEPVGEFDVPLRNHLPR